MLGKSFDFGLNLNYLMFREIAIGRKNNDFKDLNQEALENCTLSSCLLLCNLGFRRVPSTSLSRSAFMTALEKGRSLKQ